MTNNTSFANPNPPLPEVTTALDDLEKAFASVQAARSEVATRMVTQDNAATQLDQTLTQLAGYVESVAGKDDTLIPARAWRRKSASTAGRSSTPGPMRPAFYFGLSHPW